MMMGREPTLPIDLLLGFSPTETFEGSPQNYVNNLSITLDLVHQRARTHMLEASNRQKRAYSKSKTIQTR